MATSNHIDMVFRRTLLLSKLFTKSWGRPSILKKLKFFRDNYMSKGCAMELIERRPPTMEWKRNGIQWMEGYFKSPLASYAPELFVTDNLARASWRGIFPSDPKHRRGLIIHLAGTGDHTYYRREYFLANGLLKHGISAILLENPYYGTRRPKRIKI